MRPKLLVTELWGVGDLVLATPFLRAASERYDITLIAKPYAHDLQLRFWPRLKVYPFVAPWTAFTRKHHFWRWPWIQIVLLLRLRRENFDVGVSARWDPRDHVLIWLLGARERLGYPRLRSQLFLTRPLNRPAPISHKCEYWRGLAAALDLEIPEAKACFPLKRGLPRTVLVHSGAGQPVRVWPLLKYLHLVTNLRAMGFRVLVACDPDQRTWWSDAGEKEVVVPHSLAELMGLYDQSGAFIGNDSGPAHLAAACGLPTFTLFGPQLPEWFSPLGPGAATLEGKPCPYKPCSDYCRFPVPYCMVNIKEEEAWQGIAPFLERVFPGPAV